VHIGRRKNIQNSPTNDLGPRGRLGARGSYGFWVAVKRRRSRALEGVGRITF